MGVNAIWQKIYKTLAALRTGNHPLNSDRNRSRGRDRHTSATEHGSGRDATGVFASDVGVYGQDWHQRRVSRLVVHDPDGAGVHQHRVRIPGALAECVAFLCPAISPSRTALPHCTAEPCLATEFEIPRLHWKLLSAPSTICGLHPERIVGHDEVSHLLRASSLSVLAAYVIHASLLMLFAGGSSTALGLSRIRTDRRGRVGEHHVDPNSLGRN